MLHTILWHYLVNSLSAGIWVLVEALVLARLLRMASSKVNNSGRSKLTPRLENCCSQAARSQTECPLLSVCMEWGLLLHKGHLQRSYCCLPELLTSSRSHRQVIFHRNGLVQCCCADCQNDDVPHHKKDRQPQYCSCAPWPPWGTGIWGLHIFRNFVKLLI